jgi:hypothetical protein
MTSAPNWQPGLRKSGSIAMNVGRVGCAMSRVA